MITLQRSNSGDEHFRKLVKALDIDLATRDGQEHSFYARYNKIDTIQHVIVAYEEKDAVGCGAIKAYAQDTMEIKRMYVPEYKRGKSIASLILKALEEWYRELNYNRCILETGKKQPEAIALYKKNGYIIIPNYGQYENIENSICFEKELTGK